MSATSGRRAVLRLLGDQPHRNAALERNHRVRVLLIRDAIHDHVDATAGAGCDPRCVVAL